MVVLWLLPVLVSIFDLLSKAARVLMQLHPFLVAIIGTLIACATGTVIYAYHNDPQWRNYILQFHPLTYFSKNPSSLVFSVLMIVPGLMHLANAHRFGVACLEFVEMMPNFVARVTDDTLLLDNKDNTVTLVLSFSPAILLHQLHQNAAVIQSLHILCICSCSFFKMVLGTSAVHPNHERVKEAKERLQKTEKILLLLTLAWPILVGIEFMFFPDLDPTELLFRNGKLWWIVKYAAKVCTVIIEPPLWRMLSSTDFLAQVLTARNVATGIFASVGAFWCVSDVLIYAYFIILCDSHSDSITLVFFAAVIYSFYVLMFNFIELLWIIILLICFYAFYISNIKRYIFYMSRESHIHLKKTIERLTPSATQCKTIIVMRQIPFRLGLMIAFLTFNRWNTALGIDKWLQENIGLENMGVFLVTRCAVLVVITGYVVHTWIAMRKANYNSFNNTLLSSGSFNTKNYNSGSHKVG